MKDRDNLRRIAREAGAGLCEVSSQAKHKSLERISRMCEEAGFNILGDEVEHSKRELRGG